MLQEQAATAFTLRLLDEAGDDAHYLLQHLLAIQLAFSHVPPVSIDLLSSRLDLSPAHIRGVIGFYAFLHEQPRGQYDILFSDNITDQMLGNRALLEQLCTALGLQPGATREDGRVSIGTTSCTGLCDQGPAILVTCTAITRLDSARIVQIAELVDNGVPLQDWPADFFLIEDNIRRTDLLLSTSPCESRALQALADRGGDQLLEDVRRSGLRGRGGAGFSTAAKWTFCRQAGEAGRRTGRVVVCNADEGEPGTFKDRILLQSHADDVFEGMTLCAGIVGADRGFLYLRAEYLYLRETLEAVLARRRNAGLLGSNIPGQPGFAFDIEIHFGAGAYICGEESALIESLEGKRGIPRIRPPFPVTHGYRGLPTVVNNVETFVAAAKIAVHGADWFGAAGTQSSTGTKLLSISGDCDAPGIYEFPFGVSIEEVLQHCGAADAQAVQVAGAAGSTLSASEFGRRIAFEDVATGGSFMIFGPGRDLLDMVRNFTRFFVHESCGLCTPCRVGGKLLGDLVEKVHAGQAGRYDLQEMRDIGQLMQSASHCGLGTTAPNPVLDTLERFPAIYTSRLAQDDYQPSFDLDAALQEARDITGRDDRDAHIGDTP